MREPSVGISHLLTTATSTDEQRRGAQLAVLPIGSFEQHGSHLPLMTDTIVACAIAKADGHDYGGTRAGVADHTGGR